MHVLVADDELTTRKLLTRLLEKWGYAVTAVSNGEDALAALQQDDGPRLAILDWMMPELDGIELCQRLSGDLDTSYVYKILITSDEAVTRAEQALKAGADDFIRKPIDPGELHGRVGTGQRVIEYDLALRSTNELLHKYAQEMEELADSRAKQLMQADRMATLGMLSAGVAHEVNNPTTFISGNVQTLQRFWKDVTACLERCEDAGVLSDDDKRKMSFIREEIPKSLDGIRKGTKRISKIVKGLKAYARQDKSNREECGVNDLIEQSIDLCRFQFKKTGTEIVFDRPDDEKSVSVDRQRVEQVFVNLFVNASHAMEGRDSPIINVSYVVDDDGVQVAVEDNGPGIPDKVLSKIWDPFFTTKSAGKGTGLGLAISREIIEEHGGDLAVCNKEAGGARFTVHLPEARP